MKKKFSKLSAVLSVILSALLLMSVFPVMSFAAYPTEYYYAQDTQFVSAIAFTRAGYWDSTYMNALKNRLSNAGYNPWDKDFNDGCGTNSDYIAGGWKYSTDITQAIRDVKFWVSGSGSVPHYYDLTVNGRNVRYYLVGGNYEANPVEGGGLVDLNGGAGGNYIYAYITRDPAAGPPITYIKVNTNNADSGYWSCTTLQSTSTRADLNSNAGGDYIYMHLTSTASTVDSSALRSIYGTAVKMVANKTNYTVDSARALETAVNDAKSIIESLDKNAASIRNQSGLNALYNALYSAVYNAETNVYFNASANGGTTTAKATTVKIGPASTVAFDVSSYIATKANAQFIGWNTDKAAVSGGKTTVNVGFNSTLYAVFSMDVAAKFTYIGADGNLTEEVKSDKIYNTSSSTTVSAPEAGDVTYNGETLTFLGWRDDTVAGAATYTDSVSVQPGIVKTFRAVYSAPVTVSFDANGGETEAPAALTGTKYYNANTTVTEKGANFVLPDDVLMKTGFGFLGWATSKDYVKAEYHEGTAINGVTENLDLYAVWSTDYYTVTFKNYDGTVLYETNVVYNEVPVYGGDTPVKEGTIDTKWVFDGWDKDVAAATEDAEYVAMFHSEIADYKVQFVNPDGEVLYETYVDYLDTPSYDGETPVMAPTQQYTFVFKGWNNEFTPVEGPQVYTALYDEYLNSYNVQFVNYDGEVIHEGLMEYGMVPVYVGDTPVKASDVQYDYTFKGWDKELKAVEGNAVYTATYKSQVRSYEIKFVNYDGTELYKTAVKYGTTPKYGTTLPSREADLRYTYNFIGWTPEIVPVTGEATYTAQYQGVEKMMIVTFFNYDGNVLESKFVKYDTVPVYTGETPVKTANAEYSYVFAGWDKELSAVTEKTDYVAQFDAVVNEYEIVFENYDGTVLQAETLPYGSEVSYKGETPVREKDAYIYTFAGWNKTVSTVTGEATYTAVYNKEAAAYTVKFLDENGTLLQEKSCEAGEIPVYDGEALTKAYDNGYHYEFIGWDKEITEVTENAVYVAVYDKIAHEYETKVITAPTCTDDGVIGYACECGYSYESTALELGHKYEYIIEGEAAYKVCSACGDRVEVSMEEAEEVLGEAEKAEDSCEYCGKRHYKYIFPDLGFISCIISRIFTFFAELFTGKTL